MLYISGVVGSDPKTGELRQGFAAQVEQALMNVGAVLAAVHLDFGDVVKTTVLLTDIAHLGQVNECYRRFFNEVFVKTVEKRRFRTWFPLQVVSTTTCFQKYYFFY